MEEELVDSFGRQIGRKVAVLEGKKRSKCIEELPTRELKRRVRLQRWCERLDIRTLLSAEFPNDNGDVRNSVRQEGGEGSRGQGRDRMEVGEINRDGVRDREKGDVSVREEKTEDECVSAAVTMNTNINAIKIKQEKNAGDGNGDGDTGHSVVAEEASSKNSDNGSDRADNNVSVLGEKRSITNALSVCAEDEEARRKEEELQNYYNPKKPARAGLGMGPKSGAGTDSKSFSSFVKASNSSSNSVVTPFLSSFVKAGSASTPIPIAPINPAFSDTAQTTPHASVRTHTLTTNSNNNNCNNSTNNRNSNDNNSNSTVNRSNSTPRSYADHQAMYEYAVVRSQLELIPLGDGIDLEDADLTGENENERIVDRRFQNFVYCNCCV